LARDDDAATWMVYDASFEKMGALMAANGNRILGLYDELSTFLTQIKGKGINESHDLSTFLSLYNGKSWKRDTGTCEVLNMTVRSTDVYVCIQKNYAYSYAPSYLVVSGFMHLSLYTSLLQTHIGYQVGRQWSAHFSTWRIALSVIVQDSS